VLIKKINTILMLVVFACIGGFFINRYFINHYNIVLNDKDMHWNIKYKGTASGRDFSVDSIGNYYIAYKNKIQFVDKNGKSYILIKDDKLNINSMEFFDNKLYFSSNCSIYSFDLKDNSLLELLNDLPNLGDYKDSIIKLNGEELYISIGAATNSGVVGPDNEWLKTNTYYHDITPYDIIMKGSQMGAFVPYKTKNATGQIIPGHFPGNASIIKLNIKSGEKATYAWGIRNVKGMDFDSMGKLFVTVGGMENRGLRPVKYDSDYLFQIKKGLWYGWPDYSGGDPISSPRFSKNNNSFILDKQPTLNPPAPIYQHKYLNTLGTIAVDKKGDFGEKDTIYFYDKKQKNIYELNNDGGIYGKIQLNNSSDISSIKFCKNALILLDSKEGCIFEVSKLLVHKENKIYKSALYGIIVIILIGILYMIKALINENKK
jgi:hypothetical protein